MVVSPTEETLRGLRSRLPRHYRLESSERVWRDAPAGRRSPPDLIVVEIRSPLADAFVALRNVRSAHPGVPIVTVAPPPMRRAGRLSLEAGATHFVPDSPSPRELAERIRAIVGGRAMSRRPAGVSPRHVGVTW